jgi:hypothetical protein
MNLSVHERLMVLSALPQQGDYATLKILMNLRLSLSFTEEEVKEFGITSDLEARTTSWEENGEAEIPIGEKATDIIVDAFKKLDREKKLAPEMIAPYEKFILTTE